MYDILRGITTVENPPASEKKTGLEKQPDNKPSAEKPVAEEAVAKDSAQERIANTKQKDIKLLSQPLSFPKNILSIGEAGLKEDRRQEDPALLSKKLISVVKQHGVDSQERANEIYNDAVETVKDLLAKIKTGEDLNASMGSIYELLDNVFNQIVMGDSILNNIYEKKEEYYLPYHIVNTLILSSVLAINMGFNKSRLSHIGISSIFCDVGMDGFKELIDQPRTLVEDEFKLVKTHVSKSLQMVESINNINDIVKQTIRMHHKRINGSGYPAGIFKEDINPYARILSLVDTYEAMTHTRPHRAAITTHKAVRLLVGAMKNDFDFDVMKIFINKMSVYPIGSAVMLDTGELARVISVQPGSPLRPVVLIIRGANGESAKEKIIIDLSRQDLLSIKDSVSL